MSQPTFDQRFNRVMDDPAASKWLKESLKTALQRDCVDALNDAEYLTALLKHHCDEVMAQFTN